MTAVTVSGAGGGGQAVVFPGVLTLHRATGDVGVAGRRVQEVHDPNRDLHVGAAAPVYGVRPPAGVQTVGEVANAAPVLTRENVSSEDELDIPGVESGGHLPVEILQVLHEFFPILNLGLVMLGDVGAVREVIAAGFEEEPRQGSKNQNVPVTADGDQSVELFQRVSEEGVGSDS